MEGLRGKLEQERAALRRNTHGIDERLKEQDRKAREESDALRRELRAQAMTISAMQVCSNSFPSP